ncbi:MAG: DUF4105 domain-containing protein [Gammaproteobacteria bacterium]|nr:DUF4105 domain-containing protein [Gammaproteobacteria bacterium]
MQWAAMISIVDFLLILMLVLLATWGSLALYYSELEHYSPINSIFAITFGMTGLWALNALVFNDSAVLSLSVFTFFLVVLLVWWSRIHPSNQRDWRTDVERLASADIQGDLVTVRNIRNFDYRSATDYTSSYYDKTFNMSQLSSIDLVPVYWMGPTIAHTLLSFGFENGDYLAISIEMRKEKTKRHSTIKGFFKQYELYYVVADERDVIRLRTNYRKPEQDVYIYRAKGAVDHGRRLFMAYMHRINSLHTKPEFYHSLVNNCTTGIWMNSKINPGHIPMSWKILASGYLPKLLYEEGILDQNLSFEELKRISLVNERAKAADTDSDFSARIREGLPGMKLHKKPG